MSSIMDLPEGVQTRQLPIRDLSVHLICAGAPGAPLIALLHGFPELSYSWRKILLPLSRLGYFVIAPDIRGYGRTVKVSDDLAKGSPGRVAQYDDDISPHSMLNLTHDLVALVFALGYDTCASVIGHDFGSPLAGWAALIRPDVFKSVVLMSAPFPGPPPLPFNTVDHPVSPESLRPQWLVVDPHLASLDPPLKHYTAYFGTPEANGDMLRAPQGLHNFLRGYFHMKSADWPHNNPRQITVTEWRELPTYYIMPAAATMPQIVEKDTPPPGSVAQDSWLTDDELAAFVNEYSRTGFQGGLNMYRCMRDIRLVGQLSLFAGKKIEVPAMFLSGKKDWGVYQHPGAAQAMKEKACARMSDDDFVLVDGAGHWVQQEKPEEVVDHLARFLTKISADLS